MKAIALLFVCLVASQAYMVPPDSALNDAKNFLRGFFTGLGANANSCLDDANLAKIQQAINQIEAADNENGIGRIIALGEAVYNLVNVLRGELASCHVSQLDTVIAQFEAEVKQQGLEKVLIATAFHHGEQLIGVVEEIKEGVEAKNFTLIGNAIATVLKYLANDGIDATINFTSTNSTLQDAEAFAQGFFGALGVNANSCLDSNDLAALQNAINALKTAVATPGLGKFIKIAEALENLAATIKQEAESCHVTAVATIITDFVNRIASEGIVKVVLQTVIEHGFSLFGDVKDIITGIKSQNFQLVGQGTGNILKDLAGTSQLMTLVNADDYTLQDAEAFAHGFFSSFDANSSTCLTTTDFQNIANDINQIKSALKNGGIGNILSVVADVENLITTLRGQLTSCGITTLENDFKSFGAAVAKNGLFNVLKNAIESNVFTLIEDAKTLVSAISTKNYGQIGTVTGSLLKVILASDTTQMMSFASTGSSPVTATAEDVTKFTQGFFNSFGANVSDCLGTAAQAKIEQGIQNIIAAENGTGLSKYIHIGEAVYGLLKDFESEITACKTNKAAQAIDNLIEAFKTEGVEGVLLHAVESNAIGILDDVKFIVAGVEQGNFFLAGQAFGALIRDLAPASPSTAGFLA